MSATLRRAAIVSPIRTAVGKYLGALSSVSAGELGAVVLKALVERTKVDPERIDDVIFAQGYASGEAPCVARWSAMAAGLRVAVSDIGGPRELVKTSQMGRVLPARDANAWVDGLTEMLGKLPPPEERQVIARQAGTLPRHGGPRLGGSWLGGSWLAAA